MDDFYDVPSNSMKSHEEHRESEAAPASGRSGITARQGGVGSFFRKLVGRGDMDSIANIFGNAMINAVGDSIDEVTGNLTHRAKSMLYGTEDYDRGNRSRSGGGYNSYSKYYDDRNGKPRPTGSSSSSRNSGRQQDNSPVNRRWKYNEVFFDNRIFGGRRGAELAAWRVIHSMDDKITDPDTECVSVGDFFRFCKEQDPQNPKLVPEFTDENWGWDDENVISALQPIQVPGGYIIELPKPKALN